MENEEKKTLDQWRGEHASHGLVKYIEDSTGNNLLGKEVTARVARCVCSCGLYEDAVMLETDARYL